jgi:hypothetical protein
MRPFVVLQVARKSKAPCLFFAHARTSGFLEVFEKPNRRLFTIDVLPRYIAPEISDLGYIGPAGDVFALGIVILQVHTCCKW